MEPAAALHFIRDSFNDDELRELCLRLKINYEDLGGDNRSAKARELAAFCERRERVAELDAAARQLAQELASGQYSARPASETKNVTTSGGVNIHGDTINITGDVTGRDKTTSGATTATPTLRATPPRPPDHFTGREADLEKFTRLLTAGQNVAITALHGMGGIGKTSLALKLAEQIAAQFPGGVLWWTLGPHPDVITALDVWARHADPRADLTALPTAEARAEAVRPMLARLGKLCVMIDDVWDADSFNVLYGATPAGCPLLMTTRDGDLAKSLRCRVERVDALSDDEAVALLVNLLGPLEGHEDAACDIAHLTEGLPLALELIAGLADSPADLPSLAQRLREKSPLDVLKRGTTREQSIEACFTLSYEHIDADLQRRFCALGVFAPAPFDRDAIAAVWGEDGEGVNQSISQLVRRSLLSKVNDSDEYRQHALLHEYALRLLTSLPSPGDGIIIAGRGAGGEALFAARHADYYSTFSKTQDWRATEHAFDQIEHGWQWVQANAPEQIIDYVGPDFYQQALAIRREVGDRPGEGTTLNNIGSIYVARGQMQEALDIYQQALAIHREIGNRLMEGTILNNIGSIYVARGQMQEALDIYQQALAILYEVGDVWHKSMELRNVGLLLYKMGRSGEAVTYLEESVALMEEIGHPNLEANRAELERVRGKLGNG